MLHHPIKPLQFAGGSFPVIWMRGDLKEAPPLKGAACEIPLGPNLKPPHPPQLEITVKRDEDIAGAEMMSEMRRSVPIGRLVVTHEASHREALTSPEYDG